MNILKEAREQKGMTQTEVATKLGISLRTYQRIEKEPDTRKINDMSKIMTIIGVETDISLTEGFMPSQNFDNVIEGRIHRNKNDQEEDQKDIVSISYYPEVNASGGYGALNGDARFERMDVSRSFLSMCFGLSNFANIDIIHVIGDSMEPFIQSGDIIILQRVDVAKNNQIVVARIEDEVYVKRLVKDPIAQCIKLTSENPYYPDMNLSSEDLGRVQIIGIVVGKIKAF